MLVTGSFYSSNRVRKVLRDPWDAGPAMAELHVTSASNPRLKAVLALRRRRVREDEGRTVVDGYEELALALDAGVVPDTVLHCPELMLDPARQSALVARARALGAATIRCSRAAFEKVAYREGPDGFLAVVPVAGVALADLVLPPDPLVLVCEGLEKPGNLGAVLRTADAAGVAAVVAADPVTDWGNPNVVRASKGTVFSVPVADREHGGRARVVAAQRHPVGGDHPRHRHGPHGRRLPGCGGHRGGHREGGPHADGARGRRRPGADPDGRPGEPLNAATAAAVVVYEAVRQRR